MRSLIVLFLFTIIFSGCIDSENKNEVNIENADTTFANNSYENDSIPYFLNRTLSYSYLGLKLAEYSKSKLRNNSIQKFADSLMTEHQQILNELKNYMKGKEVTLTDTLFVEDYTALKDLKENRQDNFDLEFIRSIIDVTQKEIYLLKDADKSVILDPSIKNWSNDKLKLIQSQLQEAMRYQGALAQNE